LADLADQPLFVNIWATWCPPCIAELPYIEDLYEQYGKQVRFLLVSNEDPEIVTAFTEKHGYQRSQFYIARYSPSDFSTQSIPATFIVDREGRVVLEKRGAARWNSGKTTRLLDELIKN
jgi:thiol-disulfide isomerase/thioredoxin